MSNLFRTRLCSRLSLFTLALGLTASGPLAHAQTAPQLLPYTSKLIAGSGTSAIAAGATCPISGFKSLDAYGDGCLATEVQLNAPRYVISDSAGNVFFGDYVNGLVRRVDATTGIINAVAGGASSSPGKGTACGTGVSTDIFGDGCLSTAVKLGNPAGLVFDKSGNLYFSDPYDYNVRKIAATNGLIPTTGGIISLVDGDNGGTTETYGYTSDFGTTNIVAATSSYLDGPAGLAFDSAGNLYIAEYYKNALLVVNTNTTGSTTVTGVTVPATTVSKIAGTVSGGGTVCPNSPASTNGCNYGLFVNGAAANASLLDDPFGVTFDAAGNVYFTNEYENDVAVISSTGVINNFAGEEGVLGKALANTKRATAGTFAIGASFGIAADTYPSANVYISDSTNGFVWRVDGGTNSMYVVAGGATTVCSTATDSVGDGCPALKATFGSNGTYGVTKSPGLSGVYGIAVDAYADLFVADQTNNLIREVASGTQFGPVGANQPTQLVDIHFAQGDSPAAANAYQITAGANNFTLGTATCTTNSDNTQDCVLPVTATPSTLGYFTGTLQVTAAKGGPASFLLSGIYVQSPVTRTAVTYTTTASCTGTTTYSTTTPITFTATLAANGPNPPGGTYTFYANNGTSNTAIGSPVNVTNIGTTASPVYGATLTYTFATVGTYTITAVYSGDSYFATSTGKLANTITTSAPGFTAVFTPGYTPQYIVNAGQTALYSFNVAQNVYTGTISFSCSGLPANSSCVFSPPTITATGCSVTSTVALSILTQTPTVTPAGIGLGRGGTWQIFAMLAGLALALLVGMRRRHGMRFAQIWMSLALLLTLSGALACGKATSTGARTPSGTYNNIVVTITGSAGGSTTLPPLTLTVN